VVHYCRRNKSQFVWIVAFAGVAICDARLSRAAYLPVYSSPPFTLGVSGYRGSYAEDPIDAAAENRIAVNDGGIAIGTLSRVDASGNSLDYRAVRWSAS
jgi:hypothetical protein